MDRQFDEFGEEAHHGQGAIRVFFSHRSVRRMEQALGHQPVTMFKRYLNAYKVETTDGAIDYKRLAYRPDQLHLRPPQW